MTESGDSTYQSLWPLPPPHWEDADKLSPPDIPQKNLPIFGRPLHSVTYLIFLTIIIHHIIN